MGFAKAVIFLSFCSETPAYPGKNCAYCYRVTVMFISFIRTIILYIVIVITLRLMGKRQIGELEPSELVVAILISDLAAVPMQDIGIPLLSGVIPIVTLLSLELLISECSMRSLRFRKHLCGKPVFIIRDGVIDQAAMETNRLTMDELTACLRQKGILNIQEVQYAILETGGQLSTFPYPKYAPVTPSVSGKNPTPPEFPTTIISDGRVIDENLSAIGKDRVWLDQVLFSEKIPQSQVFLLTGTSSGSTYLIRKEDAP